MEEYDVSMKWVIIMDRKQESNMTSTPSEKRGPSAQNVAVPEFWEEARRNGVEGRRIEICLVMVIVICVC